MATRSGDLDPGLVSFLARSEGMTAEKFHELVNRRCGLLGVSETSGDVRELLARESDPRAARGPGLFCYQTQEMDRGVCRGLGRAGDAGVFGRDRRTFARHSRTGSAKASSFLGLALDPGEKPEKCPAHFRRIEPRCRPRHSHQRRDHDCQGLPGG